MLDTTSALADGVAAEAKYPWLPFSVSISYTRGTHSQEDDDNGNYTQQQRAESSRRKQRSTSHMFRIGRLRTLDDLKCGFELEVMGKRHLDERASHHVQDLDQGIDGSHHRAHHLRKQ